MNIIDALKDLIGYSGTEYDEVFAIISMIIVIYFMFSFFNILNSLFKRKY